MTYTHRVLADIQYVDGALSGSPIKDGYALPCPDERHARRVESMLRHGLEIGQLIRATGTACHYKILGNVRVEPIATVAA